MSNLNMSKLHDSSHSNACESSNYPQLFVSTINKLKCKMFQCFAFLLRYNVSHISLSELHTDLFSPWTFH